MMLLHTPWSSSVVGLTSLLCFITFFSFLYLLHVHPSATVNVMMVKGITMTVINPITDTTDILMALMGTFISFAASVDMGPAVDVCVVTCRSEAAVMHLTVVGVI